MVNISVQVDVNEFVLLVILFELLSFTKRQTDLKTLYKQSLVIKNIKRKLNNGCIEFTNGYLDIVFIGPERML